MDSILVLMPQMNDIEKDNTLSLLIMFTTGSPDEKRYTNTVNAILITKNAMAQTYYEKGDYRSPSKYTAKTWQ